MKRVFTWLAPLRGVVTAGVFAGVVVFGVDAALSSYSFTEVLIALGFSLSAWLLVALGLGGIGLAIYYSWGGAKGLLRYRAETGGYPQVAATLLYVGFAAFVIASVNYLLIGYWWQATPARHVVALIPSLQLLLQLFIALMLARPVVGLLWRVLSRFDTWSHGRLQRSLLTPRWLVFWTIGLSSAFLAGVWHVHLREALVAVNLAIFYYLGAAAVLTLLVLDQLNRRPGGARWGHRIASAITVVLIGFAFLGVYSKQNALLSVWGQSLVAGRVIDKVIDVQSLPRDLDATAVRPRERSKTHPNVVLVSIDTVRADETPLLGGPAKMPNLATLGQRGAVFEWAFGAGNSTRYSLPSLITGLRPGRVRGRVVGWSMRLDPRHVTLAERFNAVGYATAGFFCCDSHFSKRAAVGSERGFASVFIDKDDKKLATAAADWIGKQQPQRPFFVWVHMIEPHLWNEKKGSGDKRKRYRETLAYSDEALGQVLEALRRNDALGNTVVAVVSDHGEALGDHGATLHGSDFYNSQLRIPVVISGPGVRKTRLRSPLALYDVTETLLDLAGYEADNLDGKNYGPVLRGEENEEPHAAWAHAHMAVDHTVTTPGDAVVVGRHKLITLGERVELYDIWADPNERHDLAKREPELLRRLIEFRDRVRKADAHPVF